MSDQNQRVLVMIVAYEAEQHIEQVLGRLPNAWVNSKAHHFLVLDDGSADRSAILASNWFKKQGVVNATVFRNRQNQGYGGNQKLGYRFALDYQFDLAILLHGDGQYDPALLPSFVDIFTASDADVILGSRMVRRRDAARGGMPFYKIVGNTILTKIQNLLTDQALSEYHTGYRAYSRRFLSSVPFEINTNDFHFDTEILLQAFSIGARVEQFAIPTHYGDEICRVNGVKYALHVLRATVQYRLHHWGMLCSLKYRRLSGSRYKDKTEILYSSHVRALHELKARKIDTVLDLGCGPGYVAQKIRESGACVTGVDMREPIPGTVSTFIKANLDHTPIPVDIFQFDAILMLDVIEHLSDPEGFFTSLRNSSTTVLSREREKPIVLLTTPNIAFLAVRLSLLFGRFNYAERGILDITHKRLFTRNSLETMLRDCGYDVDYVSGIGAPFEAVMQNSVGRGLGFVSNILARIWPTLFAFQFLVVCRPRPGVQQLLRDSEGVLVNETHLNRNGSSGR